MTRERYVAAVARLQALYDEIGVDAPPYPERFSPTFEEQAEAVLAARPAAFSFVFGVPDERLLAAFRERAIATIGTATTPDEAVALDQAGVAAIVASGAEAGGHRGAFLAHAEDSLVGTLSLVRIAATEVKAPVIAAGGVADAHGVVAALSLGAEGAQVGTAFLATEESGTTPEHRAALHSPDARRTRLTRAYSGRLARGIPNRLMQQLTRDSAIEPYPYPRTPAQAGPCCGPRPGPHRHRRALVRPVRSAAQAPPGKRTVRRARRRDRTPPHSQPRFRAGRRLRR
ncbi:MAG: nitronate monooxygenase [Solirubrobacteraceae bacterium]|nr:nitronate monooxygenase [Solirubrobacteraceae bacterium]